MERAEIWVDTIEILSPHKLVQRMVRCALLQESGCLNTNCAVLKEGDM